MQGTSTPTIQSLRMLPPHRPVDQCHAERRRRSASCGLWPQRPWERHGLPRPRNAILAARCLLLPALLSAQSPAPLLHEFTDLWNGKDLSQWQGSRDFWSVRDGAITGRTTAAHPASGNTFLVWKGGSVENFELRLKVRIVADNARGWANSGIQYRSRLVDSANWVVAGYQADLDADGTYTGGMYEERGRGTLAAPKIHAALAPGQWNDYVIIVQGSRHRFYVNGTLTIDTVDADETHAATSGILALQLHAGPPMTVQFKDLRLERLPETALSRSADWPAYGGGPESVRYSSLAQINRENVKALRVAWTFDASDGVLGSELEVNPIVVHGVLYATTVSLNVVALNAATGEPLWRFDPFHGRTVRGGGGRTRGVTYWTDGRDERLFVGVHQFLYALDAKTGRTVEALPTPPGDVRAYDARTGALRWTFHTIPRPGEFGYETWPKDAWTYSGAANNWTGMSLDVQRGLVFVPTGSAADDYYGANRVGDNLFANSLLVLKAETGERVWHYQFVRHDIWDRDLPAPPNLVTVRRDGRLVDAVAQITKSGHVFLFERDTGRPLFPIAYRKYPKSDVPGEVTADSQALPLQPEPFARQELTEDMLTDRTPEAHRAVLERFRAVRSGGQFVPASLQGTIVFPGLDGGGEWGGAAVDPATSVLYVNANEMPWTVSLVERTPPAAALSGQDLYSQECASCHGADRKGSPSAPALVDVTDRLTIPEIRAMLAEGSGRMPSFARLSSEARAALERYVTSSPPGPLSVPESSPPGPLSVPERGDARVRLQKYRVQYARFLDPDGYPAVKPPWGTLSAIDLNTGRYLWKIPLGEYRELAAQGMTGTGCENYGGPVVTAGGLVFIGATNYDAKFRAFDKANGALLWETTLPAAGNATPAIYTVNGRQFIVIATSGGKAKARVPARYVAFALGEPSQ